MSAGALRAPARLRRANRVALLAVAVMAAACQPAQPDASAEPDAAAPRKTAAGKQVPAEGARPEVAPLLSAQVDRRALAGRFSDGDTVLELREDGSYVQELTVAGSTLTASGRWVAADNEALLLDPDDPQAAVTRIELRGNSELRVAEGARTFRRLPPP